MRKLRLTGGEPLVRKNIMWLFQALSRHLESGALEEITVTTNGSQLGKYASELAARGVRRINVSLDTRDPAKFREITRWGDFGKVVDGIRTAQAAGLKIKVNMVALKGVNEGEIEDMVRWCHGEGMDMTLIETMPLGDIEGDRTDQYLPLSVVRARLMDRLTLEDIPYRTGGPARYVQVRETGGRLGFITPLTHNFCESCNRVRITCTGTLFMCLGQNDAADLRAPLRASASDDLAERRHRRGHRPQAQGPRLRNRPPRAKARRGASYEPDRRLGLQIFGRFVLTGYGNVFPKGVADIKLFYGNVSGNRYRHRKQQSQKAGNASESEQSEQGQRRGK